MLSGSKWLLIGLIALALGLTTEAGAQTLQPASSQQLEIVGPASSTTPIAKGGKKGKKHKHKKKATKHGKKSKQHGKGKKGKKGK
jgi:hypothetical protein